jgi:dipeptide transport system ATP-binding protein
MPLLEIENLSVTFPSQGGAGVPAVDGLSITLEKGEVLGIVGESGCGKSVGMLAIMGLVPFPGRVKADRMSFEGRDLLRASERERRAFTGNDIAMIFQEPTTSLNPSFRIGYQIAEVLRVHQGMNRKAARRRVIELLEKVGIPAPESRLSDYPHQLSGGMNQRVMIAMAIACNPKLLIADEPTTALDVTIQAQILDLLLSLQRDRSMALILITHNMGVVADTTERVAVMYAGQIMEEGSTERVLASPQHPYTAGLLAARPEASDGGRLATIPGVVPGAYDRPRGCLFSPRCVHATPLADDVRPDLRPWMGGQIRCHYPLGDPTRNERIAADRGKAGHARATSHESTS